MPGSTKTLKEGNGCEMTIFGEEMSALFDSLKYGKFNMR